jgi:hypothetical protein
MFAIGTDWRAPGRGILASAFVGMCFATVANVPIYFIGRGFGTPARPVISLTGVTQALVISALIAGESEKPGFDNKQIATVFESIRA